MGSSVLVNSAPTSGTFSVAPLEGDSLATLFTLRALNWVDDADDLPLSFQFRYSLSSTPAEEVPISSGGRNIVDTPLAAEGGVLTVVTVIAYIRDSLLASARSNVSVTVRPINASDPAVAMRMCVVAKSDAMRKLQDAEGAGDANQMLAIANSLPGLELCITSDEKEDILQRLKRVADNTVFEASDISGFASAASRTLSGNSSNMSGSLVSASSAMGAVEDTASQKLGDSLSSLLTAADAQVAPSSSSPQSFVRAGRRALLSASGGGNRLRSLLDGLSSSQVGDRVEGEDARPLVTDQFAMVSSKNDPTDIAGSKLSAGGSEFSTPSSLFES